MLNKKIYLMMSVMIMNGYGMTSSGSSEHIQSGSDQESTESQSSDDEKGDQFILQLENNPIAIMKQTSDFKKLSEAIKKIKNKYGAVYFVAYAGFRSSNEKIRFKDPRWVFFSFFIERTGITGDFNHFVPCKSFLKNENVLFDYITEDWNNFSPENVNHFKDILAPGGKICISMSQLQSVKESELLQYTNKIESLKEEFHIYLSDDTQTPAFYGEGSDNLIKRIDKIREYLAKHIPKDLQNFENDEKSLPPEELHDKYLKIISNAWSVPKPKEGFESTDAAIAEIKRRLAECIQKDCLIQALLQKFDDDPKDKKKIEEIDAEIKNLKDIRIVFVKK